jgi:hypothetical protein
VKANGSLRNWSASPMKGAPIDPGGGWLINPHRTTDREDTIGRAGDFRGRSLATGCGMH